MSDVALKPYVSRSVPKIKVPPVTVESFLQAWEEDQAV